MVVPSISGVALGGQPGSQPPEEDEPVEDEPVEDDDVVEDVEDDDVGDVVGVPQPDKRMQPIAEY